jgi:hypothetical protein
MVVVGYLASGTLLTDGGYPSMAQMSFAIIPDACI